MTAMPEPCLDDVSEAVLRWVQHHDVELVSWTAAGIAEELDETPEDVNRSLLRLRDASPSYIAATEWSGGPSRSGGTMVVAPRLWREGCGTWASGLHPPTSRNALSRRSRRWQRQSKKTTSGRGSNCA